MIKKRGGTNKGECVITNRAAAKRVYSPKFFFSRTKALALTVPHLKPEFQNDTKGGRVITLIIYCCHSRHLKIGIVGSCRYSGFNIGTVDANALVREKKNFGL